jgi:hypothetical protein
MPFLYRFYHILIQPGSVNVFSLKPCSSGLIFFWVSYGDVYSTERIWYWLFKQSSRLLRMKPSVLFPLPTIFSLCLSQNNSSLMVTLRHLLASTMHITCFHLVVGINCLFLCSIILITMHFWGNEAYLLFVIFQ